MYIRVTKAFTFEMAHLLPDYPGACRNIHGHSYKLEVTLGGNVKKDNKHQGMVIDFKEVKKQVKELIIEELDHALVVPVSLQQEFSSKFFSERKIVTVPFTPTSENLLGYISNKLKVQLAPGPDLIRIRLQETESSWAEWVKEDQE